MRKLRCQEAKKHQTVPGRTGIQALSHTKGPQPHHTPLAGCYADTGGQCCVGGLVECHGGGGRWVGTGGLHGNAAKP